MNGRELEAAPLKSSKAIHPAVHVYWTADLDARAGGSEIGLNRGGERMVRTEHIIGDLQRGFVERDRAPEIAPRMIGAREVVARSKRVGVAGPSTRSRAASVAS